jgi:hypothetical protein
MQKPADGEHRRLVFAFHPLVYHLVIFSTRHDLILDDQG